MDRRTLLAVLLIMAVLIGDQILMSRWNRQRQARGPARTETPAAPPATQTAPPAGSAARPEKSSPGAAEPVPGTPGSPASVGSTPGTSAAPRVARAPITRRQLRSDRFIATFTTEGGAISEWVLPAYPDLARKEQPVNLVEPDHRALRLAVSTSYFTYDFSGAPFRLASDGASDSSLTFVAEDSSGVRVVKTYRLSHTPGALDLEVRISVPAEYGPIQFRWGWGNALPVTEPKMDPRQSQAVALVGDRFESFDAGRLQKSGAKEIKGNVRWAGDRSKYFVAAIIPDSASADAIEFAGASDGRPTVWLLGAAPPGTHVVRRARLYAGPIHYDTLVAQGAELDRLANLGWRWITGLSALLLWSLNALYKLMPNYGVAIILISVATKLVFYPLTQSSLRSMKLMHNLQPQVKAIQERHKGDPPKMNQAMMDLYKRHKVNPLGGCLPMLLQIPVFFALYNVLLNSIELRGAGFVGYVRDLSVPDVLMSVGGFPIHFFPLLMTGSTYLMQWQTPVAPAQKPMMMLMPVMMLVFMYSFPSGVVLYWTVNNILSAAQQYLVNAAEDRKMAAGS